VSGLKFRARICVARALMSVAEFFADLDADHSWSAPKSLKP
jgi:hypothetical protein